MPRLVADAAPKPASRLGRRVAIGFVLLVSVILLILWRADSPRIEQLRMGVADALLPSMSVLNQPIEFASNMIRDYRNFLDIYTQNRELRREIQRLRGWRSTARTLEEENAQLRALNNVQLRPRTTFITGDVVSDSGGPYRASALVNVGRRDGVIDGSAAIDGEGLVGRVVGVGERAARLLLLTDYASRVPVVIQPEGHRAILAGDGTALPLLEFIDSPEEVTPGALIETSGDGRVFPPDLPVGRVVRTAGSGFRANLAADYRRLEFVRVLRYRPDTVVDRPGEMVLPWGEGLIGPPLPPADSAPADAGQG